MTTIKLRSTKGKARPPMLVMRSLHNTDLELKERAAVVAFQYGCAKKQHYDLILDMQGILILAGNTSDARKYAKDYAENVLGPVLLGIKERYDRTDKLGVNAQELRVLQDFVEFSLQFWVRQPIELYSTACEVLQGYYDSLKGVNHESTEDKRPSGHVAAA